jgi:predicted nucleic acid-binding protein
VASLRIVNASPLILLGKIGQLALLDVGGREVIVPDAVFGEVEDASRPVQLPGWDPSLTPIRREADVLVPPEVLRHALDPGESMVLALALSLRAGGDDVEVVLDEKKGRRAALALGLPPVGTAGLLMLAKVDGRIPNVAPLLDQLERVGMYLGEALRSEILEAADE